MICTAHGTVGGPEETEALLQVLRGICPADPVAFEEWVMASSKSTGADLLQLRCQLLPDGRPDDSAWTTVQTMKVASPPTPYPLRLPCRHAPVLPGKPRTGSLSVLTNHGGRDT